MRKPIVAGNWKMNKTVAESRQLVAELVPGLHAIDSVERVLCPPFTSLMAVAAMLEGTEIHLGAQDMYWEIFGAFTGQISPLMLKELCQYVIIGHSERRTYFGETDETVNRKMKAALAQGLLPIMCVGETLVENEAGRTAEVVSRQMRAGLAGMELKDGKSLCIAYEPIWAIGTGRAATADGANKVIVEVIRLALATLFNPQISQEMRVLYGGSVTSKNAADFFTMPDIDGALVGGASLKVEEFVPITQAAVK